jgi:hypothetical protein
MPDPDPQLTREALQGYAGRYLTNAAPAQQSATSRDCSTWTDTVERRLAALEDAVTRQADVLQALLLRLEDGK